VRSAERAAENESTFREVNEKLEKRAGELALSGGRTPYLCECDDERCTQVVLLTGDEYEQVRAGPRTFVMVAEHQSPDDSVIRAEADYVVIEKTGEKGALVEQRHPRR
jgi:hypothetical protein